MRITNIDTISALIDRLITERIKLYFFDDDERIEHQTRIVNEIKDQLETAFAETKSGYEYISEKRTFSNLIEQLVWSDLEIGQADRAKLAQIEILKQELRARTANELRATTKNNIDKIIAE